MLLPSAKRLIQPQNLHRSPIRSRGRCGLNLSTKRPLMARRLVRPGAVYLYDILKGLGLLSSFQLCLDAADPRSYDGVSQTWTDIIGGNNFFLGADGSATGTDPTFVGGKGAANQNTSFSFDGGDYFTEVAAHTFADNWHKDNGQFTVVFVFYNVGGTSRRVFSNSSTAQEDGIGISISATEKVSVAHATSNVARETVAGTVSATPGSWNFVGLSFNEAALAIATNVNGVTESIAITASTATDNNGEPLRIAADGDASSPMLAGERLACIAAGSTALGLEALANIRTRLRARFPMP